MLHFRMNMPFVYMALYGSIMIVLVLLLRAALKKKLPGFVFPVLWGVVLLRLLVPFSLSSPMSLPVPALSFLTETSAWQEAVGHEDSFAAQDQWQDARVLEGTAGETGMAEDRADMAGERSETVAVSEQGYDRGEDLWNVSFLYGKNLLQFLYLAGLAGVTGFLGWQKYSYARRLKGSFLMEHNETVNTLLREMDMGHVLVFTSDQIASPLVCGLRNPRIYLPTRMDFQNTLLLRHVLAHETMHVRRGDNWLKCVMVAALALHWYNPLVWILSKCLASDLEAACDSAVLANYGEEERKSYAFSLLAMAVTGSRTTLLYSAFSRTEVEKRVKGILHYRKATAFVLALALLFTLGSTVVFATGGQAPFSTRLTAYCFSSNCRWGGYVQITRDIALGKDAQARAEGIVISVLGTDKAGDPGLLEEKIRTELAEEFGVEKRAFAMDFSLCLDQEEIEKEYEALGLTQGEDGFWLYQNEPIRIFHDKMLGCWQTKEDGAVDVSVQRDRLGYATSVTVWRQGEREFEEQILLREAAR